MASSFSDLGIELMATGENAGTWGTKTNTNLQIVEKAVAGYVEQAVTSGGTTALTITDGDATESTSVARHAVIKLTGTISGNSIVTVPDSIEKVYIVTNGTSGAYTVQFKTASGTGITFGVSEKTTKLVYSDGTNLVDAGFSGGTDLDGNELILDADADTSITADTDDQIDIKIAGADDFQFTANTFTAQSGSSIVVPEGGLTFGSTAITSTAAELNILDGVTSTAAELNILDGVTSTAAELNILDGVTSTAAELNLVDGITAGTVSASKAVIVDSNKDLTGFRNLTISGDLTVSGDDITMGTNTAGNILVADGTNFNSVAVGGLSEISTVANDDVFLAVDTSGGGLKKIARSAVVAGLATSGAISNVVEDTSPQLGGDLDTNSANILIDDAHFIADENGNEQIIFQTTSSAVNQFDVTNAATGNPPQLSATGGDSNIDLNLLAKGTGHVTIVGNTNSGAIQFNCENNSHGQILKAQPHSASVTNVMLLPDGADSTLVSLVATQTLTNKTLTTPVIAEIDSSADITLDATNDVNIPANVGLTFGDDGEKIEGDGTDLTIASSAKLNLTATSDVHIPNNVGIVFGGDSEKIEGDGTDLVISANNLTIDAAADIILDAAGNDFNFKAGGTEVLRITNSSSDVIIRPVVDAKDIIFQQADGTEVARIEDNGTFNVVTSKLAINGTAVTSTAAELNLLDGVSGLVQADLTKLAAVDSTAAELNIVDGGTSATSTTLVDADRFVVNDNGTMVQVAASDLTTYINSNANFASVGKAIAMAIVFG
jgi:hypothetical protein